MNKTVNKLNQSLLCVSLLIISNTVTAYEWVAEVGLQTGGDELATYDTVKIGKYNNYNIDGSIYAGGGLSLLLGALVDVNNDLRIKAVTGIVINRMEGTEKISTTDFKLSWTHVPVEVSLIKQMDHWNFGAGLTMHFNPHLSSSGSKSCLDRNYKNALGFLVSVDYHFNNKLYVGGKYTVIDYKLESGGAFAVGSKNRGNSFGLVFGCSFGGG